MKQGGWSLLGPLTWSSYVSKQVMVKVANNQELRGWLQTVDPVSASLVLVNFREGGAEVQVVMGHAVEEVQVLHADDQDTPRRLQTCFRPPRTPCCSPDQLRRTRTRIRLWLQQNQVPVEEEGDVLRVAGVLTLAAPYRPEDCCSSNQIILDRIQKLIRNLLQETDLDSGPQSGS